MVSLLNQKFWSKLLSSLSGRLLTRIFQVLLSECIRRYDNCTQTTLSLWKIVFLYIGRKGAAPLDYGDLPARTTKCSSVRRDPTVSHSNQLDLRPVDIHQTLSHKPGENGSRLHWKTRQVGMWTDKVDFERTYGQRRAAQSECSTSVVRLYRVDTPLAECWQSAGFKVQMCRAWICQTFAL